MIDSIACGSGARSQPYFAVDGAQVRIDSPWADHKLFGNLGVGEASGMFPIDSKTNNYDERMIELFNDLLEVEKPPSRIVPWKLQHILPKVLVAGDAAGLLTEEGAAMIDPTGQLRAGIPLCPPEGDAGTGMVDRITYVLHGTSEYYLLCRWSAAEGEPAACPLLTSTFRIR